MSVGRGSGIGLAECFWVGVSQKTVVKTLTGAAVICQLGWGWRVHLRDGPLTWLANCCWLSAGHLSFLPHGCFHTAASVTFGQGNGLPRASYPREPEGNNHIFYDLASEVAHHHFCHASSTAHKSVLVCGGVFIPRKKGHWGSFWRQSGAMLYESPKLIWPQIDCLISIPRH